MEAVVDAWLTIAELPALVSTEAEMDWETCEETLKVLIEKKPVLFPEGVKVAEATLEVVAVMLTTM